MRRRALIVASLFCACDSFDEGNARPETDAGTDVGIAVEAGTNADASIPFCRTDGGTLCEDFDDPGSAALPTTATDGGGVTEILDPHFSSPRSLRATAEPPQENTCRIAVRHSDVLSVPIPDGFRIEYRIRAVSIPGALHHVSTEMSNTNDASDKCSIYMRTVPTGASLVVEPAAPSPPRQLITLSRKIVAGEWSHVVVEIRGGPGGRRASVTIDGTPAATDVMLEVCQSLDRLSKVVVGLVCVTPELGGNADVAFDDVRVIAR